jgi:PPOX class probable F420-dependent enzyme
MTMAQVPPEYADLFTREQKAFAYVALVMKDGTPQVSPVWFDFDGTHIIINTARGRVKDKILHRHPAVAITITNPVDPYRYVLVRGKVVEETEVGGYEMICRLNEKYHGKYEFAKPAGQVRVTYKILPERFMADG